ncbi:MAG: hypothetical protein ACO3SY_04740 [Flavobacteriaceae bacterium]|jgi:hypothetical protein
MKRTIQIFMIVAVAMLLFNLYQVNWETPLEGKSTVAVIGALASACALLLLLILQLARKINQQNRS